MSKIWSRWHMYNIFIEINEKSVKMTKSDWNKYWSFLNLIKIAKVKPFWRLVKVIFSILRRSSINVMRKFDFLLLCFSQTICFYKNIKLLRNLLKKFQGKSLEKKASLFKQKYVKISLLVDLDTSALDIFGKSVPMRNFKKWY